MRCNNATQNTPRSFKTTHLCDVVRTYGLKISALKMKDNRPTLSQELWKNVLEFTSVCTIRVMDTILLEDTLEMGERIAFDEETTIMKYRPVSRVFADSVLELITSVSIPQDTTESRSGRLQKLFLSRPVALQTIELFYPSDRLLQPCPLDNHVWDQLALCNNLRHLTIDQNSHLSESNLRVLSEKNGKKLLSLRFCSDISDGVINHIPDLFPNLETLELQAKSHDQLTNTELRHSPDMSRFSRLKCLTDKGAFTIMNSSCCEDLLVKSCFQTSIQTCASWVWGQRTYLCALLPQSTGLIT